MCIMLFLGVWCVNYWLVVVNTVFYGYVVLLAWGL